MTEGMEGPVDVGGTVNQYEPRSVRHGKSLKLSRSNQSPCEPAGMIQIQNSKHPRLDYLITVDWMFLGVWDLEFEISHVKQYLIVFFK
jgi:hypothetical protein